jgi:integrase
VSTGCKDKNAARQVLANLESRAKKIRAGILSSGEAAMADWTAIPLSSHIENHESHLRGLGRAPSTVTHRLWFLQNVFDGCGWRRLSYLNRSGLDLWLNAQVNAGMGARNRNAHAAALVSFANWLVQAGRLSTNPFAAMSMLNEKADRRRERRVMNLDEFGKMLDATERRPLAEASLNRNTNARISEATIDKLKWLGKTRAMIYRVLMFYGLRYSELRSITLGQVYLDADTPYIELKAANEKARRGALVPLPSHLAEALGQYIPERKKRLTGRSGDFAAIFPGAFNDKPLFDMPGKMTKVFDFDLLFAKLATVDKATKKIIKSDAQGRTLDIHALRHSFCAMIAQSGVNMQTAQRLMRHASPTMTAWRTHLTLSDLGGAMEALQFLRAVSPQIMEASETVSGLRPIQRPIDRRAATPKRAISCNLEDLKWVIGVC